MKRKLWLVTKWIWIAAMLFLFALLIKSVFLIPVEVEGRSMNTALQNDDYVIMNPQSKIKRFDIIVFETPSGKTYIKRVIGLPGEKVTYHQDHLVINGKKVPEPFIKQRKNKNSTENTFTSDFTLYELTGEKTVPPNTYFVMGDNRRISKDSRTIGPISKEWVKGKVIWRYYPLNHFGTVKE